MAGGQSSAVRGTDGVVRFRGGAGRGLARGSWPFGLIEFSTDRIAVRGPFARSNAHRTDITRVVVRRRRLRAVAVSIERVNGTDMKPVFCPARPGTLIDELRRHHWPVSIEAYKPRVPAAISGGPVLVDHRRRLTSILS